MKFVRYEIDGFVHYGVIDGEMVRQITTTPFDVYEVTDHQHVLSQVKLLAPCTPSKMMAMALNYKSHLGGRDAPKQPEPFYKVPSSIIGPGDPIILPRNAGRVDQEAELVAVIGRRCRKVSKLEALSYVLGYTCGNDVSARVWQKTDMQFWRAKASDTFSPIGPSITTDIDGANLEVWARVNGIQAQNYVTSDLLFDIPTIISTISQVVTLEPGDLIFTGTGGKTAELHEGDVVEIEIQGIGTLSNPVKAEE